MEAVSRRKPPKFRPIDLTDHTHQRLTKSPHHIRVAIQEIANKYRLPALLTDLWQFLSSFNPGLSLFQSLPPEFEFVDVWHDLRVETPMVNDAYRSEWRRVRANPSYGERQLNISDPVLIHETDEARVGGLRGE